MDISRYSLGNNLKDGLAVSMGVAPADSKELWSPLTESADSTGVILQPVPMILDLLPAKAIERMLSKRRKPLRFNSKLLDEILKSVCAADVYFGNDDVVEIGFETTNISPDGRVYMVPEDQEQIRELRYDILCAIRNYLDGIFSIPKPKMPDANSETSKKNGTKGFYLPIGQVITNDRHNSDISTMLKIFRHEIPHPGQGEIFDVAFDTVRFSQKF